MKSERRIRFVLFVACLVAAIPYAQGQVGLEDVTLEPSASLEGMKIDVLKVGLTLCHIPPGDPANAQTIVVGEAAVAAHLAHGDYLGGCHLACSGVPSAVPKTGQTTCWEVYTPTDCAGTGQDGEYQNGVAVDPRFTDNSIGTVVDNLTGLIWTKNARCFGLQKWTDALSMTKTFASGQCGVFDGSVAGDWRLPNLRELQSLIDYHNVDPALPTGHPFYSAEGWFDNFWSSTTFQNATGLAWSVDPIFGFVGVDDKFYSTLNVWPVRGGQ